MNSEFNNDQQQKHILLLCCYCRTPSSVRQKTMKPQKPGNYPRDGPEVVNRKKLQYIEWRSEHQTVEGNVFQRSFNFCFVKSGRTVNKFISEGKITISSNSLLKIVK